VVIPFTIANAEEIAEAYRVLSEPTAREMYDRFGHQVVAGVFDPIVSAEDTTRCKPDPMGYELCIEALASRIGAKSAARALVNMEDYEAAASSYALLLDHQGGDAEGWFQWGFCLQKLGRSTEALEKFQEAARAGSKFCTAR